MRCIMIKWLIPCNVKNFDIIEHFKKEKTAYFKRNRALSVGDEVYIYVAKPFSEIKFKGHVIKTGIPATEVSGQYKVSCGDEKSFIEVELDKVFPDGTFSGENLKIHGLGQVVNQQIIRGKIEDYILDIEGGLQKVSTDGGRK